MITYELAFIIGGIVLLGFLAFGLFRKMNTGKIIVGCAFIAYLSIVAAITLFPILYDEKIEYFGDITWYNFIPFRTISDTLSYGINLSALIQIAGNICMAVPYGIIIMVFFGNKKWWKLLLLALLLPVAVELAQLVIGVAINNMYRTIDIDDVILNLIGVYIGYGICKILPKNITSFCTER